MPCIRRFHSTFLMAALDDSLPTSLFSPYATFYLLCSVRVLASISWNRFFCLPHFYAERSADFLDCCLFYGYRTGITPSAAACWNFPSGCWCHWALCSWKIWRPLLTLFLSAALIPTMERLTLLFLRCFPSACEQCACAFLLSAGGAALSFAFEPTFLC